MEYNKSYFEKVFSTQRMERYFRLHNDEKRAITHYQSNLELAESFYPCVSILEVALRNAISSDKVLTSVDKVAICGDKVLIKWSEVKERCLPNTIKILEYLAQNGSISNAAAREITGLSASGVRRILNNLIENKIAAPEGDKKSRVYHLMVEFIFDLNPTRFCWRFLVLSPTKNRSNLHPRNRTA